MQFPGTEAFAERARCSTTGMRMKHSFLRRCTIANTVRAGTLRCCMPRRRWIVCREVCIPGKAELEVGSFEWSIIQLKDEITKGDISSAGRRESLYKRLIGTVAGTSSRRERKQLFASTD